MLTNCRPLCLALLCGTALAACSSETETRDPRTLPYTLETALNLDVGAQTADLDGDGFDEVAMLYTPSHRPPGVQAVWLKTYDGRTIEQANFEGRLLRLHFLDLDADGVKEILVPYVRHDSLFLGVVDAQGQKQGGFFLADGEPRREPEGELPWDPQIEYFYLADIDAEGLPELVTVIATEFARYPRGVLIHQLPSGQLVGNKLIGGKPGHSVLGNFDEDPAEELMMTTFATNNGAASGGFDDAHAYVIAFDLSPIPEVLWSKQMGELWTGTDLAPLYLAGDDRRELFIATTTTSSKPEKARFEVVEAGTGRTLRHRSFAEPLRWPLVTDLDRDAQPEIVVIREPDEVWVLDKAFEVLRRQQFPTTLREMGRWPDLDGDGIDEIVVHTAMQVLLLDPMLRLKAAHPRGTVRGVMHRGVGVFPYLLLEQEGTVVALELVENRLWWLYRFGPIALGLLGLGAVLGGGLGLRALYQRNRFLQRLYPATLDAATNGVLVVDGRGHIVLTNAALCAALGLGGAHPEAGTPCDAALDASPRLMSFVREALASDPPHPLDGEIAVQMNGNAEVHRVTAEPLFLDGGSHPHWVVALHADNGHAAQLDARTWAMMAKKVTHDLKTPLTNILLTTQRLQTELRKQAPDVAEAVDPYAERIIERVTALRRMTRQFMKVLDVEALDLVPSDLSAVVGESQDALARDLPSDIDLAFDLHPDLPLALLDHEQIQSALANLVANAFHALPTGGTITVSTVPVLNLRMGHTAYEPRDYVMLEVQDNGVGIDERDRPRLFEPGYTTTEFGTGLGLSLVRRVCLQHGGFVEVESETGVGSVFSLYVPTMET